MLIELGLMVRATGLMLRLVMNNLFVGLGLCEK